MGEGKSRIGWRFRVRTLLLVVALVAVVLGGAVWGVRLARRREARLARAFWYAQLASNDANHAAFHDREAKVREDAGRLTGDTLGAESLRDAARESRRIARQYEERMKYDLGCERKFQYAADHPWQRAPEEPRPAP